MSEVEAIVLIRATPEKARKAVDEIRKIEGVKRVDGVTGRFDIVAMVTAPDLSALASIVLDKIAKVEGVISTETLLKIL